jgi:DNA-binding SARP family transcriptional activator
MEFRILGPVEASSGGQPLQLGGARPRALLAYLLLHTNEIVSAERLLDQLWSDPPGGGVAVVQTQISRLRKPLGERIATTGRGYQLHLEEGDELDLERFRALLAQAGTTSDPAQRSTLLQEAVGLWRGEPLAGIDAPFITAEAAALDELRLGAIEARVDADLERGRHTESVGELGTLISEHPLRERLRGQLILALYRSGRQAEALDAYRSAKCMLDEELGLEPSPALRELERAILTQDESLAPPAVTPARAAVAPEPSVEPEPRPRRGAPLGAVALVGLLALGGASAAAVALTQRGDKATNAAQTDQAPPRTQTVTQPRTQTVASRPRKRTQAKRAHQSAAIHTTTTARRLTTPATSTAVANAKPATTTSSTHNRPATTSPSTVKSRKQAKPATGLVTITDSFNGSVINPAIWDLALSDSNVTVTQQNGQLVVTVGANAQRAGAGNQIDAQVGTQCRFPGNFDARVDYTLLEWPPNANILIGLNAVDASAFAGRESKSETGDVYAGWAANIFGSVPLPDATGSLRIVRHNGIATSYFRHDKGWTRLASGPSSGAAALGLQASSASADTEFGHQEVKVAFDNFKVQGVNPSGACPIG